MTTEDPRYIVLRHVEAGQNPAATRRYMARTHLGAVTAEDWRGMDAAARAWALSTTIDTHSEALNLQLGDRLIIEATHESRGAGVL